MADLRSSEDCQITPVEDPYSSVSATAEKRGLAVQGRCAKEIHKVVGVWHAKELEPLLAEETGHLLKLA